MTSLPSRFRNLSALLAVSALCVACGGDRVVAGGTTSGAEAENAVAARVVGKDGKPVRGASVRARPANSLSDSVWKVARTDSGGMVSFVLDVGTDWRLEAVSDTLAAQVDVPAGWDPSPIRSLGLAPRARLAGRLFGGRPGDLVRLAGLGRVVALDSTLQFSFGDLPEGGADLRYASWRWNLVLQAGSTLRVSLDTTGTGSFGPDPLKPALQVANLPVGMGPDALVAIECSLSPTWIRSSSRLVLIARDRAGGPLPLAHRVASSDSVSGKVRIWARTPADFRGGDLLVELDTLRPGQIPANPFQGRGMAATVLFSLPPGKSGSSDSWENFSQPGRNLVTDDATVWQQDAQDPMGAGIVASAGDRMLQLPGSMVTADLSRISVRMKLSSGWQGSARLLQISDSSGRSLALLARQGDTLVASGEQMRVAVVVAPDSLWHTYTWERTGAGWRLLADFRHLLAMDDPAIRPAAVHLAEGGRIRLSEAMLWADTSARESVPLGGRPATLVVGPVR